MLTIVLPSDQPALQYATTILFDEFLGLEFSISCDPTATATEIRIPNGSKLILADHFFQKYSSITEFICPQSVSWAIKAGHPFLFEDDLPILFGQKNIRVTEKEIVCSHDVLATIFFMLSRWEEYANPVRDHFQRFPAKASLAVKHGFHHRPIVDEYVEMVWNMLTYLGIDQPRKKREYQTIITHDVDIPLRWQSPWSLVKAIGGDLVKRKSPKAAYQSVHSYLSTKSARTKDPFDTFDYLMDLSEKYGLQSHFFFLCGGQHKHDKGHLPPSHPFMQKLMEKIDHRGHIIGFHPSFDTFNNPQLFKQELELLQQYSPQEIKCGRQHFLRFEVPTTWRIWEENRLEWESSLYYAEEAGFRCGTCHAFPVFDCLERKVMRVKEVPLSVMEVTWVAYQQKTPLAAMDNAISIFDKTKKYNGNFVLLWHNTSLEANQWKPYKKTYEGILEMF